MDVPIPTPIFRLIHVDNLHICLRRRGAHAPNHTPDDGLPYKTIHNVDIQAKRRVRGVRCGPGGVIHDYVSFYFGPRSPMLYQLHTGWVEGYREGQEPLIYLVSTAQAARDSGAGFVFSDGHGIAAYTRWFDDLKDLGEVDWDAAYATRWNSTVDDMDCQRRKQAEFLVHRFLPWDLVEELAVLNRSMKAKVETILADFPEELGRVVRARPAWYY